MRKASLLVLALLSAFGHAAFAGDESVDPVAHEKEVRKEMAMPPDWFGCNKSWECGISYLGCEGTLAVRADHKAAADKVIVKNWAQKIEQWKRGCIGGAMKKASSAVCNNNECIGRYNSSSGH